MDEIADNLRNRASFFRNPDYKRSGFPFQYIEPLAAELEAAADEIDRLRAELQCAHQRLGNLLAVIHRDGGHYQDRYGVEEAAKNAEAVVCDLRAEHDRLKEVVEGEGLREAVAAVMHEVWVHWMWYLFSCGKVTVSTLAAAHWRKQMDAPYADLAEIEKESDREQADKVLAVLRAAIERQEEGYHD